MIQYEIQNLNEHGLNELFKAQIFMRAIKIINFGNSPLWSLDDD